MLNFANWRPEGNKRRLSIAFRLNGNAKAFATIRIWFCQIDPVGKQATVAKSFNCCYSRRSLRIHPRGCMRQFLFWKKPQNFVYNHSNPLPPIHNPFHSYKNALFTCLVWLLCLLFPIRFDMLEFWVICNLEIAQMLWHNAAFSLF